MTIEYLELADSALHAPTASSGGTEFYPANKPRGETKGGEVNASMERSHQGGDRGALAVTSLALGEVPGLSSSVEPTGIEPVTSCLQSRRSPS